MQLSTLHLNQRSIATAQRVLLLVVLVCCGLLIWKRWDLFAALTNISAGEFLIVTVIGCGLSLLGALKFRAMLPFFPLYLSTKEWFGLTAITTLYGKILPARMGFIPRAWYLKKHHSVKFTSYVSILGGSNVVDLLLNSLLGFSLLPLIYATDTTNRTVIEQGFLFSLGLGLIGMLAILACRFFKLKTGFAKLDSLLHRAITDLTAFQKNPISLFKLACISALLILSQSLSLGVCLGVLESAPGPVLLIVAICAVNLSTVVSITPGNIGIAEGLIVAVLSLGNVPLGISVSGAILYRASALLPQIGFGLIFTYILFGKVFDVSAVKTLQKEID